jgi:preprotein translocase subunit SecG
MGFTEIGVVLFLVMLLVLGFFNSRKVSQELKKLEAEK